jgi:glycerol transport system permease protein
MTDAAAAARAEAPVRARAAKRLSLGWLVPTLYILFLMLPIYWLVNMSFKTTNEILGTFSLWPQQLHHRELPQDLHRSGLVFGYINSLIYVTMNTVISVAVALPAAYAFSRYRFLGDKHLFFWLLTNRMAPPAIFVLPFIQLYSSVGLFDTHIAVALAHLPVQHPAGGLDPRGLHVRRAARRSTRPPISTAIPSRSSS